MKKIIETRENLIGKIAVLERQLCDKNVFIEDKRSKISALFKNDTYRRDIYGRIDETPLSWETICFAIGRLVEYKDIKELERREGMDIAAEERRIMTDVIIKSNKNIEDNGQNK